jgi:NDP-sugar pyrophosphorylase family protein
VNFSQLLNFHQSHGAAATMCVREYDFQIPYGVVRLDKHRIASIEEKPVQRCFVNAGIYVLEPRVLSLLPVNERFDMPALFGKLVEQQQETSVFPIREYWLDIGQMADYERANGEFTQLFS